MVMFMVYKHNYIVSFGIERGKVLRLPHFDRSNMATIANIFYIYNNDFSKQTNKKVNMATIAELLNRYDIEFTKIGGRIYIEIYNDDSIDDTTTCELIEVRTIEQAESIIY